MKDLNKFIFPAILIIFGLLFLVIGAKFEQNSVFMIAAVAVLLSGVVSLLTSLGIISKNLTLPVTIVIFVGAIGLSYLNYRSIKDPVDFKKERERRYKHVVQRLKDLRSIQLAYKNSYGKYTANYDTLLNFLKTDSFRVVKAIGNVPDAMTEMEALEAGIISRDTLLYSVADSLFNRVNLANRVGVLFIDSLPYVPFTNAVKFTMETAIIEKGSVKVPVFQIVDSKPFDKKLVMQVGSLTEPSTSGNWEK
jgi:ABC-type multidrug transport system fused ATPase/permease subunit